MRPVLVLLVAVLSVVLGRFAPVPDESNPCGLNGTYVKTIHQAGFTGIVCRFTAR
jgi:hypothetical protein